MIMRVWCLYGTKDPKPQLAASKTGTLQRCQPQPSQKHPGSSHVPDASSPFRPLALFVPHASAALSAPVLTKSTPQSAGRHRAERLCGLRA